MAIKAKLLKNGIKLDQAYIRPVYFQINFQSGLSINYETFPTAEKLGQFPNESLQGVEITKEESGAIKKIVYGIMKRTELLKDGEDC